MEPSMQPFVRSVCASVSRGKGGLERKRKRGSIFQPSISSFKFVQMLQLIRKEKSRRRRKIKLKWLKRKGKSSINMKNQEQSASKTQGEEKKRKAKAMKASNESNKGKKRKTKAMKANDAEKVEQDGLTEDNRGGMRVGGEKKERSHGRKKIFTQNDEIILLEGMIHCGLSGDIPASSVRLSDLYDFLDGKLESQLVKRQISSKKMKLKQKFFKNMKKFGNNPAYFTSPHEAKLFKLSKEIWDGKKGAEGNGGVTVKGNKTMVGTNMNKQRSLELDNIIRKINSSYEQLKAKYDELITEG